MVTPVISVTSKHLHDMTENFESDVKYHSLILMYLQQVLTSLAANSGRHVEINRLADDIMKKGTSQQDQVKKRQKDINDR